MEALLIDVLLEVLPLSGHVELDLLASPPEGWARAGALLHPSVSRGLRALTEPPGWGISVSRSGEFQMSVISTSSYSCASLIGLREPAAAHAASAALTTGRRAALLCAGSVPRNGHRGQVCA
jgi:hypothetical protein